MKLKLDWQNYIQEMRSIEVHLISEYLNGRTFENGLEIGAGNGFQSQLLVNFIERLTCTELNEERLIKKDHTKISYEICDAEIIDYYFPKNSFDFIYSAHLLEHLTKPQQTIKGCFNLLKDGGIVIHIIPSSFNAFLRIVLWYPNILITLIEKYLLKNNSLYVYENTTTKRGNNLKSERKWQSSSFRKLLWPRPHGVSTSIFYEIAAFSKSRWLNEFRNCGFHVQKIIKGPVHSGYGFGFGTIKKIFAFLGICGENIFILKKY